MSWQLGMGYMGLHGVLGLSESLSSRNIVCHDIPRAAEDDSARCELHQLTRHVFQAMWFNCRLPDNVVVNMALFILLNCRRLRKQKIILS